jgi:CAAX prenyl protease-like protein
MNTPHGAMQSLPEGDSASIPYQSLSAFEALRIQLIPGVASLIIFVLSAYLIRDTTIPIMFALVFGILLGEAPISWFLIVSRVRRETGGRFDWEVAFPWRARVPIWVFLAIGIPSIVLSTALMFGLLRPISHFLLTSWFSWTPDWLLMTAGPGDIGTLPAQMKSLLLASTLIVLTFIGGLTQEYLSRGYLLPRTAHLGPIGAPVLNAMGFAMLHFVAPWDWPVFFAMTLIWSILVYRLRSVRISIFIHVGMLLVQSLGMTMMILGLVPNS